MLSQVDTRDSEQVEREVEICCRSIFPDADLGFISRAFLWLRDCFAGRYSEYQQIDARYHDLEHTLQGALCMVRLLLARHRDEAVPRLTPTLLELGLLAILLHDTGYLKRRDDTEGTGAKYTLIHVSRSAEFAARLLTEKGYSASDVQAVQNMIRCTGVNVDLKSIPFQSELERVVGYSLGTADLLGQMAAEDYIEKLPILYTEFAESAAHNQGQMTAAGTFSSAEDLMRKTPLFWEHYVRPKIDRDFLGLYRHLTRLSSDGSNYYMNRIERNMKRLQERLKELPDPQD